MTKTIVDIGIACAPSQVSQWWTPVMTRLMETDRSPDIQIGGIHAVASALPDHNKNYVVDDHRYVEQPAAPLEEKRRNDLTDSNRNAISSGFLYGKADWIFWMDDDTVPPHGVIPHLLSLGRAFVSGVYYLPSYPHNPLAYYRQPDGTYAALLDYPMGALIEVDSVGMGCALIHRSVYEKIRDEFTVFSRPNGSLIPVHKDKIKQGNPGQTDTEQVYVSKSGVVKMVTPLGKRSPEDKRPWPYYALEYGRTEDHHFCELTAQVGIRPYLDTTVQCEHWKMRAVGRQAHRAAVSEIHRQQEAKDESA